MHMRPACSNTLPHVQSTAPSSQTVRRSPGLVPRVLNALCPGLQLLALGAGGLLKVVCQLVLAHGRKAALGRQGTRRLRTAGVRRQRKGRGQCEAGGGCAARASQPLKATRGVWRAGRLASPADRPAPTDRPRR